MNELIDKNFVPMRMLRRGEVERRTGLKRSTIYESMAKGYFPKPIKIGVRIVCWPEHEIEEWLQDQVKKDRGERCPIRSKSMRNQ